MAKKLSVLVVVSLFVLGCVSIGLCDVAAPKNAKKQTTLKLYTDAKGAYKMIKEKNVPMVDVRTPEELQFVGNTGLAINIPWAVWSYKWDEKKSRFKKPVNEKFVDQIKALYKPDKTLIILCRSGHRSAAAVNALAKAGFKKAYTVLDGFEGDKAKEGPQKGQRVVNGWKNAKLPWTYKMKKEQTYTPK
jgi:rhodanese-related sulfurtransferase